LAIYFYSNREEPYGCFSNFSHHSFELDGHTWLTSEHYFQAQKFVGTEHYGDVKRARSASDAAKIGRERGRPLRADWEAVKDDAMRRAVLRKFETHVDIRKVLLDTGDEELIENTTGDYYWGIGSEGTGKNMLGIILMEVREVLRRRAAEEGSNVTEAGD
jgi:N-glycosidase YbiA